MDLVNFIFRMGVLFAVYGFIWWIIDAFIGFIGIAKRQTIWEHYTLLLIKYLFLANVCFLFCVDSETGFILNQRVIVGGMVLVMYYIGKMQRLQNQLLLLQVFGNSFTQKRIFDRKVEIITISFSSLVFILMIFFPYLALNPIAEWFLHAINTLENTPVFGFFFKIFGFIFLVSVLVKMIQAITLLLTGNLLIQMNAAIHPSKGGEKDNDQFDDFEELD